MVANETNNQVNRLSLPFFLVACIGGCVLSFFTGRQLRDAFEVPEIRPESVSVPSKTFTDWSDFHVMLKRRQSLIERNLPQLRSTSSVSVAEMGQDTFKFPRGTVFHETNGAARFLADESVYHEAFVHPAMITVELPASVAILGNDAGATLCEVLKHKCVKSVLVHVSEEVIRKRGCFADDRVEIVSQGLREIFAGDADANRGTFDVIFLDDGSLWKSFSAENKEIVNLVAGCLSPRGVLAFAPGIRKGSGLLSRRLSSSMMEPERMMYEYLESSGFFQSIYAYQEVQRGLSGVWCFVVCLRDVNTRENWFANQAAVDLYMHERLREKDDEDNDDDDEDDDKDDEEIEHGTRWFDGATMKGYQFPSRIFEESFCKEYPKACEDGHGLNPAILNVPISSFAVQSSTIPGAGRGVFFQEDAVEGTYLAADESVHDIIVPPITTSIISKLNHLIKSNFWRLLTIYLFGYGFANEYYGEPSYVVDSGILTFINHGCNGTQIMGEKIITVTEMTADPENMHPEFLLYDSEIHIFNPFIDRNSYLIQTATDKVLRNVTKGTELLDNYLKYLHEGNWKQGVLDYRAQCLSSGKGAVTDYEQATDADRDSFLG